MSKLARKISAAKWEAKDYLAEGEISADALSSCLRTQDAKLSFWVCSEAPETIRDVVLAVASTSNEPDRLLLVVLDDAEITTHSRILQETDGKTPVADLRSKHRDLAYLSIDDLCELARIIAPKVRHDKDCYVFSKKEVLQILRGAIDSHRLTLESLHEKLRNAIRKLET